MASVRQLLSSGDELTVENPRRDAEILLGHCLGKPRSWLYTWPEEEVDADSEQRFRALLQQRGEGRPVAYLTGEREFWTLSLSVSPATLIPRPETETLVNWALELPADEPCKVLDLGTGSGAIALALASERPHWQITAVDACDEALAVARDNARRNQLEAVQFRQSDWYRALRRERFDIVVANPPYIDAGDPHLHDLRFEPRRALVAANAGLADIAVIVAGARAHLHRAGRLLIEHGFEQGAEVRKLFTEAGFEQVVTRRDLAGLERVTGGRLGAD